MARSPSALFLLTATFAGIFGCSDLSSPKLLHSWHDSMTNLKQIIPPRPEPSAENKAQASSLRVQGLALRSEGRLDEAIAILQQAVTLDPTEIGGYVILGWTQHLATQRQEAEKTLQMALAYDGDHVPALNALGIVYLVDGQLEQAVQTHTHALSVKSNNEIAAYNLSLAYQRLQRYDEAIQHANLATELEPHNPHPWVALAIAHESHGNRTEALQVYQHTLTLDSRYGDRTYLLHLEHAGFSPDQIALTETLLSQIREN